MHSYPQMLLTRTLKYPSICLGNAGIKRCSGSQSRRIEPSICLYLSAICLSVKQTNKISSVLHSNSLLISNELTGTLARLQITDIGLVTIANVSFEYNQAVGAWGKPPYASPRVGLLAPSGCRFAQKKQNIGGQLMSEEKRIIEFSIMMSISEMAELTRLAKASRIKKSVYLRAAMLNNMPKIIPAVNSKLAGDLGHVGSNLNQLAREKSTNIKDIEEAITHLRLVLIGGTQ